MQPLIHILAPDVDVEGVALDEALPAPWLDAAMADAKLSTGVGDWEAKSRPPGGRIAGRVSRSGNDIVVRADVTAVITLACSRCLAPTEIAVVADLSLLLEPSPRGQGRRSAGSRSAADGGAAEYEFSEQDADLDVYDGEAVVLDGFIREAILLELPQFPLCSEACVGIPAGPSKAGELLADGPTAVDPRLAPLGALRNKLLGGSSSNSSLDSAVADSAQPASRNKLMLRSSTRRRLRKKSKRKRR